MNVMQNGKSICFWIENINNPQFMRWVVPHLLSLSYVLCTRFSKWNVCINEEASRHHAVCSPTTWHPLWPISNGAKIKAKYNQQSYIWPNVLIWLQWLCVECLETWMDSCRKITMARNVHRNCSLKDHGMEEVDECVCNSWTSDSVWSNSKSYSKAE